MFQQMLNRKILAQTQWVNSYLVSKLIDGQLPTCYNVVNKALYLAFEFSNEIFSFCYYFSTDNVLFKYIESIESFEDEFGQFHFLPYLLHNSMLMSWNL